LWRRKLTILVSVVVAVVAALVYSKVQTPQYQSTALIVESTPAATGTQSTSPVVLPDAVQQLGSTAVQLRAASILKNPNVAEVASEVTGTVDTTSGSLTITATNSDPAEAQAVARAYSQAFVDQTQALVQIQLNKINTALTGLTSQIAALQTQPGSSNNAVTQAQISGLTSSYSALQAQESTIKLGEPYSTVQVAANLPTAPTGLSKSKLIGIGIVAGLLVGCGLALGRDNFDTRLRTSPDIEAITDSPILAELPQDQDVRSGKVSIAMVQAPQSLMAESIRELRTSLRVILGDAPCPVLVVTSPEPGDGKTFVAANLAVAWALSGSKVIVISADFRRPRMEDIFGLQIADQPGLSDLIKANWKSLGQVHRFGSVAQPENAGARSPARPNERRSTPRNDPPRASRESVAPGPDPTSVSSFLVESGVAGLQVLPVGTQLDNPSELFGSPGMQPVLAQLPMLADIIVMDTPPVLAVPDTAILGSLATGAVVVASEGKTDRVDLERTVRRLETTECTVLGVALNRVRRSTTDSYQSYAYKQ
jgi:Mrp family chromosome partitioning ATPase/capsular polysaccharide biosynthesis protein